MFNFEKLDVWKESVTFTNRIYSCAKNFPKDEQFGLTSQLKRASLSIALNIAEGAGRHHKKEFIHFLRIAIGSLNETITLLLIALHQGYLENTDYNDLYQDSTKIFRMLNALIKSLA